MYVIITRTLCTISTNNENDNDDDDDDDDDDDYNDDDDNDCDKNSSGNVRYFSSHGLTPPILPPDHPT